MMGIQRLCIDSQSTGTPSTPGNFLCIWVLGVVLDTSGGGPIHDGWEF